MSRPGGRSAAAGSATTYHRLPGKQRASIDGRTLEYVSAGDGRPTIVFLSGAGMDVDSWSRVYPAATTISTVVAYNRLGTGRSDSPTVPQSGAVIVGTLQSLLLEIGLPPPYVLVGHSLGGLYASHYARQVPGVVSGVVLVDSSGPDEIERLRQEPAPLLIRAINKSFGTLDSVLGRNRFSETASVDETIRQIRAAGPFPSVPLIVVSGGRMMKLVPAAAFRAHFDSQRDLVAMSPQGRQVVAVKSGHFPQIDEPEVVIDAIREVVDRSRNTGPS